MLWKWTTSLQLLHALGHFQMKTKYNANIGGYHVSKLVTYRIKRCRIVFLLYNTHNASWWAPHIHMPPPNMATSATRFKHVIARWRGLLIMEDGGCGLTFAKVTNPDIIKATAKSPCITHPPNESDCTTDYKPKIGVWLKNLIEIALSTLVCAQRMVHCRGGKAHQLL